MPDDPRLGRARRERDRDRARGATGQSLAEVGDQRGAGRRAVGWALRETAGEHLVERRGQCREVADRRRGLVRVRRRLRRHRVPRERTPAGEELEGDAGERVAVGRGRGRLAARLLGRHVPGRSQHRPRGGERVVSGGARDAEVRDAEVPVARDEEVRGLDVAMDDSARVRRVERGRGLPEPPHREVGRHRPGGEPIGDRAVRHVLHDDERKAVGGLADVVDRDDVRLARERRGRARLPEEALAELVLPRVALREHLDRDGATEPLVGGAIDVAHPAVRDELLHGVAGRERGPRRRHRRGFPLWPAGEPSAVRQRRRQRASSATTSRRSAASSALPAARRVSLPNAPRKSQRRASRPSGSPPSSLGVLLGER